MNIGLGLVAVFIFCVLQAYLGFTGLDLRKPKSWFLGVLGFFCGFFTGPLFGLSNLIESIGIGIFAGFWTLLSGAITRRRKQKYGGPYTG